MLAHLAYETGPLGEYYLAANSPLLDAGSVWDAALADMYHYVSTADQVKERNSRLNIGFHYPEAYPGLRIGPAGPWQVSEDVPAQLLLVRATGSDPYAGLFAVSLAVDHGRLTVALAAGVSLTGGINGHSGSLVLEGAWPGLNSTLASLEYLGLTNYHGADALRVTLHSAGNPVPLDSREMAITVQPLDDPPVAAGDTFSVAEDTVLTIAGPPGILANDWDEEGDALWAVLVRTTTHGSLSLSTNGGFAYRPATNYCGLDSFTYAAYGGGGQSAPATVMITVAPVNDAPTLRWETPTNGFSAAVGAALELSVAATDVDMGGAVTNVEFFVGTNSLGVATNEPYRLYWSNLVAGAYTLWARGTDDEGATNDAAEITITVDPDSDGDGVSDITELRYGTDPNDRYNGNWPMLEIVSGNFQVGSPGAVLGKPMVVRVRNNDGVLVANAPVLFKAVGINAEVSFNVHGPWSTTNCITTGTNGDAVMWGKLNQGESSLGMISASLGVNGTTQSVMFTHQKSESRPRVIEFGAGWLHHIALLNNGQAVTWGYNPYGVIGSPSMPEDMSIYAALVWVQNLRNVKAISAGMVHNIALLDDGTVVAWGYRTLGPTGGDSNPMPTPVTGLSGVRKIRAGFYRSYAIGSNGNIMGWGENSYETLKPGLTTWEYDPIQVNVSGLESVSDIAVGRYHTVAVKSNGTVICWGSPPAGFNYSQTIVPAGLEGVASVSAGDDHSMVLLTNGTVRVWGRGQATQVPAEVSNVVAIASSGSYCSALRQDGRIFTWGDIPSAQNPPEGSNYTAISGGSKFMALNTEGGVFVWNNNRGSYVAGFLRTVGFEVFTPLK